MWPFERKRLCIFGLEHNDFCCFILAVIHISDTLPRAISV